MKHPEKYKELLRQANKLAYRLANEIETDFSGDETPEEGEEIHRARKEKRAKIVGLVREAWEEARGATTPERAVTWSGEYETLPEKDSQVQKIEDEEYESFRTQ